MSYDLLPRRSAVLGTCCGCAPVTSCGEPSCHYLPRFAGDSVAMAVILVRSTRPCPGAPYAYATRASQKRS